MSLSRERTTRPKGRQQTLAPHAGNVTVRYPSPLQRQVVIEDEEEDDGCHAGLPSDEELSGDEDDLPDAAYSQEELTQDANTFRSPSPPPTQTRSVYYYLAQDRPTICIFLMPQEDAVGLHQASKKEGHKAVVKYVSDGQAIVKYSKKPRAYREVASFLSIRTISTTERQITSVVDSVRRCSRSMRSSGRWFWLFLLAAGLFGVSTTVISLCLGFDVCVDIVSNPIRLLAELALLVLGCVLYVVSSLVYAGELISDCLIGLLDFVFKLTALANERVNGGSRTLIRSAVAFLESFIDEDL